MERREEIFGSRLKFMQRSLTKFMHFFFPHKFALAKPDRFQRKIMLNCEQAREKKRV
jgi:hypothetical protein